MQSLSSSPMQSTLSCSGLFNSIGIYKMMEWNLACGTSLGSSMPTFLKKCLKVLSFFCRACLAVKTKFISLFQGCRANIRRSWVAENFWSKISLQPQQTSSCNFRPESTYSRKKRYTSLSHTFCLTIHGCGTIPLMSQLGVRHLLLHREPSRFCCHAIHVQCQRLFVLCANFHMQGRSCGVSACFQFEFLEGSPPQMNSLLLAVTKAYVVEDG